MRSLLLGLFVLLLAGCSSSPEERPLSVSEGASREAALALLDSLQQQTFREAFRHLRKYNFTRRLRIVQLDAQDRVTASRQYTLHYTHQHGQRQMTVQEADSTGTFDFGLLGQFTSPRPDSALSATLSQQVLSEEPPFLSARNREAFTYRLLSDTTLGAESARVIEVQARPEAGEEQAIRRARLYITKRDTQLVGVRLHRRNEGFLFSEQSRLDVLLHPTSGTWLPHQTRFTTRLHVPLLSPQAFRTSSTYADYQPATPGA